MYYINNKFMNKLWWQERNIYKKAKPFDHDKSKNVLL